MVFMYNVLTNNRKWYIICNNYVCGGFIVRSMYYNFIISAGGGLNSVNSHIFLRVSYNSIKPR